MKKKKSILLISILVIFCFNHSLKAQKLIKNEKLRTEKNETKVIVIGEGENQKSALNNAFNNAINEAVGVLVSSSIVVENDELKKDEFITYSKGFIKEYKILSKMPEQRNYRITIAAIVVNSLIFETLEAKGVKVNYNTGGMFAQMDQWETKKKQEFIIAKSLMENIEHYISHDFLDFEIEVHDPDLQNNNLYKIPVTVRAVYNKNYQNYIDNIEALITEMSFNSYDNVRLAEKGKYVNFDYKLITMPCEFESKRLLNIKYRELDNVEKIRMKKAGIKATPVTPFSGAYAPEILVFTREESMIYNFLDIRTLDMVKKELLSHQTIKYKLCINTLDGKTVDYEYNLNTQFNIQECELYKFKTGTKSGQTGSIFEGKVYDIIETIPYRGFTISIKSNPGAISFDSEINGLSKEFMMKIKDIEIKPVKN